MPIDAVFLTALRNELTPSLLGAKIDRITMPERDMVVLSLHSRESKRKLLISAGGGSARIHLTEHGFENPAQPPMFCMLLRKHLLGGRITAVTQPPMERSVALELDTQDELGYTAKKQLILELMGKSRNLILVGEDGRVLDCLHHCDMETNAVRPLLPGLFYAPPPAQDKPGFFDASESDLAEWWEREASDAAPDKRLLESFSGLSPLICRELCAAAEPLTAMRELRRRVAENDYVPTLLREGQRPRDFSFMPVTQYGELVQNERCGSFSELLDSFYTQRDREDGIRRRAADLTRTAKTARDRLLRKLDARERELKTAEKREDYRRRGELITANMYRLKKGMASFETQDFYAEDCPTVTVPLDVLKTPQQNAAMNFKLYSKAKTARSMLAKLIEESREESIYLDSVLHEIEAARSESDLADIRRELTDAGYIRAQSGKRQKLPPPRRPMRFVSDSGMEILVGRGNVQNDELTHKLARRTDYWLHAQKIPGSHVIITCNGLEPDETTLHQAAVLAATYSRSGGGRVAVDCTMVRNVRKPAGARPGRVLYTEYTTVLAQPDEALAGRLKKEN